MLKIRQKKEILAKRSGDTSKSLCQQYRSQHVQSHCLNGWWSISREIRWRRARNEWESWLQWSWWSRDLSYAGKVAACKRPVNKVTTAIRNLYFRLLLVDSSEIDVQSQVRFLAIIWFKAWFMKVHHKKDCTDHAVHCVYAKFSKGNSVSIAPLHVLSFPILIQFPLEDNGYIGEFTTLDGIEIEIIQSPEQYIPEHYRKRGAWRQHKIMRCLCRVGCWKSSIGLV